MAKGLVVVITGASSVGKGDIRDALLQDKDLKLFKSISMTTRPPKEGEIDGVNYYFVSYKDFAKKVKNKELLEYNEFNGYYYGIPKNTIEFLTSIGKNVLIEVESQSVGSIKLQIPDALAFFVKPESIEDLKAQIAQRYKDDEASIELRINKAKMDMELGALFRHSVSNENTEEAVKYIKEVVLEEMSKRNEQRKKK